MLDFVTIYICLFAHVNLFISQINLALSLYLSPKELVKYYLLYCIVDCLNRTKILFCRKTLPLFSNIMAESEMIMIMMITLILMVMINFVAEAADTNDVYDPCSDSKVQKLDGFTFGLAFSTKESFFFNQTQLSPCDKRLSLSDSNAQLAVFRPKVDEISLLSIDGNTFDPVCTCAH